MICVVIKGPSFEEARQQIANALPYADLVELRLDGFHELNMAAIQKLQSTFTLPMIFTLRSRQQGGNYQLSEEQRLHDLNALAKLEPTYLDIESHVPLHIAEDLIRRHPGIRLIISYHNFSETPQDLEAIYHEMRKFPAQYYKIAVTARDSLDGMRLCCWAKHSTGKIIAISMGPHGQISRILGPIIRSPITYASLDEGMQSAPGQLSAHTLLTRYHYRSLNPQTAIYGLIGDPVDLSISDETHNALIQTCGLDAVYLKIVVKPAQLPEFLQLAKQLPIKGLSVTMPLKECIMTCLDQIDAEALAIGAVNTLLFEKDKISGFNTDGKGALNAIEQECLVKHKRIVILGAGGAAKAIAYEAQRRGGVVMILNRDQDKAQQLASRLQCSAESLTHLDKCVDEGYDILINCTPLSMPVDERDILPQALVMDIKTKPKETSFLTSAQRKGCQVIYGYKMFVGQAVGQFRLWFKDRLEREVCRRILEQEADKALGSSNSY